MTPELLLQTAGLLGTALVAVLAWSLRRNVAGVDDRVRAIDEKIDRVETDVRQLSSQGARHGESLAAGMTRFAGLEKRLDKAEDRLERFQADCIACRVERASE